MTDLTNFIHLNKVDYDFSMFISFAETLSGHWTNAKIADGQLSDYRQSRSLSIQKTMQLENGKSCYAEFQNFHPTIDELIIDYKHQYDIPLRRDHGWSINKYSGGGFYNSHYDWHPNESRTVSAVVLLNTPESGGQLDFPLLDFTVPAESGFCAIFPSCYPYLHRSLPADPVKYSLVTWLG